MHVSWSGRVLVATAVIALIPLSVDAEDTEYLGGPPPGPEPLEVRIGFNLVNLTDINESEETIDFDASFTASWLDPRLAYDPAVVGTPEWEVGDYSGTPRKVFTGDFQVKEAYEGWRPHLFVANGIGNRAINDVMLGIWPDGTVLYRETFSAKVEAPMQMRRYPFDRQQLDVFIHPFVYQRGEVVLVPHAPFSVTWNQNLGIAQWVREGVSIRERPTELVRRDESTATISELVATIDVRRRPQHVLLSIIFPLVLLVSLTWVVFWMDEESISDRINISFIGILSVVAYYFVILDSVPDISCLTLMDAFILLTFLVLSAGVVVSVVVDKWNRGGRKAAGDTLDRVCRWAFPLGYALITAAVTLLFFNLD